MRRGYGNVFISRVGKYRDDYWNYAGYRNTASFCKLWRQFFDYEFIGYRLGYQRRYAATSNKVLIIIISKLAPGVYSGANYLLFVFCSIVTDGTVILAF